MCENLTYEACKTAGSDVVVLVDEKRDDIKTYVVFGEPGCGKSSNIDNIKRYFAGFRVVDNWDADVITVNTVYISNLSFAELTQALGEWPHPLGLLPFSELEKRF